MPQLQINLSSLVDNELPQLLQAHDLELQEQIRRSTGIVDGFEEFSFVTVQSPSCPLGECFNSQINGLDVHVKYDTGSCS